MRANSPNLYCQQQTVTNCQQYRRGVRVEQCKAAESRRNQRQEQKLDELDTITNLTSENFPNHEKRKRYWRHPREEGQKSPSESGGGGRKLRQTQKRSEKN